MPKIIDPDSLIVGTNLTVNTTTKQITLTAAGALIAKDGVTLQALYSKLVELWTTATYNKFPFPIYTIDARSGQFQVGTDGSTPNGWTFATDATRQMIRDAGWSEFSAGGDLLRQYVGLVALASGFPAGAQFYYQRDAAGAAINFTFTDAPNEGIQVFGDAANGNFDDRDFFKIYSREPGFTYDDAVLADVGEIATGAFKVSLPVTVAADTKITADDATVAGSAPYTGIDATYFATNQSKTIGGGSFPFRVVVDGNNATLEQIYTKAQYMLRQVGDIDAGAGTVPGKTANQLMYFLGDTLYTTLGVFIENIQPNDINRIVLLDQNGVPRTYPFAAAGTLTFNAALQGAGSYYRMYFGALPSAGDDFGEAGAVTVKDASVVDIAGTVSGGSIGFTFDYDGNVQGGRTAGTDAPVVVVAGRPGFAKPVVAAGVLSRSKGITIALVAEADRGYSNP